MKTNIRWFFGIVLLFTGFGALSTSLAAGVIYIFTGLFLIPPILDAGEKKFNLRIPTVGKYLVVIGALLIGGTLYKKTNSTSSSNTYSGTVDKNSEQKIKAEQTEPAGVGVGQVLKTNYFDVVVNKVEIRQTVRTGNQFADKEAEAGIQYLILNVTFKNTDNESRMIDDGSVFINYGGKEYEYDKSEIFMLNGWGILLDQINPLTSKKTNIVYKIPTEITGPAYYEPGRNYDSKRVYLGDLK